RAPRAQVGTVDRPNVAFFAGRRDVRMSPLGARPVRAGRGRDQAGVAQTATAGTASVQLDVREPERDAHTGRKSATPTPGSCSPEGGQRNDSRYRARCGSD